MPACESRLAALSELAGACPAGDLAGGASGELASHLAACDGCRAELEALRRTESLLRATANEPEDFMLAGFAIRAADRAEAFRDRSARGLWWSFTRAMRFTLAFSGAAVAASALLFALSQRPVARPPLGSSPSKEQTAAALRPSSFDPDEQAWPAADDDSDPPDVLGEMALEDWNPPDVSIDSALDALSPDELDEIADEIASTDG